MRQETIISLLLKNLKEAQQILEDFEDDKRFNRYYQKLMFEFANTIQKAEKLVNTRTAV